MVYVLICLLSILVYVSGENVFSEDNILIAKHLNEENPNSAQKFIEGNSGNLVILPEESNVVTPNFGKRISRVNTANQAVQTIQNSSIAYFFSYEYNSVSEYIVRKLKTSDLLFPSHYFL